jgi:DNA-binding winged helix-turn-helix (wHTH) protein/Tol biopolymer transport system component
VPAARLNAIINANFMVNSSVCVERGAILGGDPMRRLKFGCGTSPFLLNVPNPLIEKDSNAINPTRLQPFRVGDWQVHPEFNELRGALGSVRVQPRLIQVLRLLALTPGRTVTRDALIDGAWSRRMVNDEVLSRTIADLRQALGDDARQPRYLETIPKLGYRLIAQVEWLHQAPAAMAPTDARAVSTDREGAATATASDSAPVAVRAPFAPARNWITVTATLLAVLLVGTYHWRAQMQTGGLDQLSTRLLRAQPLTSDPGWELTPRFARAIDLIAYSNSGPRQSQATLMLRSRDGRVQRAFTDGSHYDVCPTFSPDDREILWTRHGDNGCEILRAPLLGGAPVRVASCAADTLSCPDWAGNVVVYSAPPEADDRGAGLAQIRIDDGSRQSLTNPLRGQGNDTHPRVAADGRIAFSRGVEGDRSLWLWRPDSGERRIDFASGMVYGQTWLNDQRLLAATDALGFRALVAIDPVDGSAQLLGARGARYPDVAADGALIFEHASYDANLWRVEAGAETPERLTQSLRYDAYPRLAPDGRRVLYQTNRDGPESLYLLDLGDLTEHRLPLDPAMRWAQPAWSADGSRLLLTRYAAASGPQVTGKSIPEIDLWQFVLGSDQPTPLTAAPAGAFDAQLDPDGAHAWCRVGEERAARLQRFRLDGGGTPLTRSEIVEHYQIDAQGLFLVQDGDTRLFHCREPTATCSPLAIELAPNWRRNWALAEGAVYFVGLDDSGQAQLRRHDLVSNQQIVSPWPVPGTLGRGIDVDRRERFAIIARTDRVDIDLQWLAPEPL